MVGEKFRICRVVPDLLPPDQAYGYFVSFYHISRVQRDKGQNVLILKPANNFSKEYVENFLAVSIPLRKRGFIPSDRKRFLKTIESVVGSWDADIIHTHISVGSYLHGIQMLPPTLHHLHGLPYQALKIWKSFRDIGQGKSRLWDLRHDLHADRLYKKYLKKADAVVAYCASIKSDIIQRYQVPPNKVHVVFNGVSSSFIKQYSKLEIRRELGLDEDSIFLLFVGRLVEGKGIVHLFKALQFVKKKYHRKNIKLLIVGSQFGTDWLQSLVRAITSRRDSVIEIPHIPYEHLPKYYSAADIHILSHSYDHGFPKTCLESLACGTPVIMTKNLDSKVIIDHNECGMLLNNGKDHLEIAKKILFLVEHEDLSKKMGERGKKLIHKKYTWERTVENLNEIYRKVIDAS